MALDGNGNGDNGDADTGETREWLDSLSGVLQTQGPGRARFLLQQLRQKALRNGVDIAAPVTTPYVNTITPDQQPPFPGNRQLERRIKSLSRWNAMAMVLKANKGEGVGGHIASYASLATLYEIGFNHFFHGPDAPGGRDFVFFQGHSTPGIYARAYLLGRLSEQQLKNFRRELAEGGGLSSYPHPWLMPEFWQFPTVSMGLGPLMAIYQARFLRYLHNRGLKDTTQQRVFCFLGDGETDEPESLGSLSLASREHLDNLVFIINCNLQRLDGPVRGNGKIIQELEAVFRGAGWNVIKVIWGSNWDPLLARDKTGLLVQRMNEVVDGELQRYSVETGAYIRKHFFGKYPELLDLVKHMSDEELAKLGRGGHDPLKVYAAYKAAVDHKASPTVILAHTVKGYGMGEAGEGKNIAHQQKKVAEEPLTKFIARFELNLTPQQVHNLDFYKPPADSPEMVYLHERRKSLGGYLPQRRTEYTPLAAPGDDFIQTYIKASTGREVSTTMASVDLLRRLLEHKELGKQVVPIIPDEARTFGMESFFTKFGIYAHDGQLYEPVDHNTLISYREAKNGQILEEGITEAGSMSSFIAAGTSYSTLGLPMLPFFIYYSMFGFQRIGDLIWAAADMRTRGFLIGGTAGRTTLNGEGLQHQDGHSPVIASTVPSCLCYDPAFAYEIGLIVQEGIRRMYQEGEDVFYYLTVYNENYTMEPMPAGAKEGVLQGMYRFRAGSVKNAKIKTKVHLLGSGPLLRHAVTAQEVLAASYGIEADVWSVTSYKELRRDALACERWNRLHPTATPRRSYVERLLQNESGVFIAVSDYMKCWAESIQRWVPGGLMPLGTDGFGRSEIRPSLRRHFEIDAEFVVLAALEQLARRGALPLEKVAAAIKDLGIDPEKADPVRA